MLCSDRDGCRMPRDTEEALVTLIVTSRPPWPAAKYALELYRGLPLGEGLGLGERENHCRRRALTLTLPWSEPVDARSILLLLPPPSSASAYSVRRSPSPRYPPKWSRTDRNVKSESRSLVALARPHWMKRSRLGESTSVTTVPAGTASTTTTPPGATLGNAVAVTEGVGSLLGVWLGEDVAVELLVCVTLGVLDGEGVWDGVGLLDGVWLGLPVCEPVCVAV